ncbi:MAG: hypothetical protein CTY19_06985 [Methylomonas sp.]|nr:MAG: hypothetical protein CTY19_06985 [Methylomonas sp.]
MDINLPVNLNLQLAINKLNDANSLNLKLHQVLEAKIVDNQIMLDTLTLKINDKIVNTQAKLLTPLPPGQSLQLQVVKLLPTPEFKILAVLTAASAVPKAITHNELPLLKLLTPPLPGTQSSQPDGPQLSSGLRLSATVMHLSGDKLTLQILPTTVQQGAKPLLLTLNTQQLLTPQAQTNPAASPVSPDSLKPGMPITLQVIKAGDTPSFALMPAISDPEQRIREALKQLLPMQSSPTALLTQLQHALPRLQTDASVAETLKQAAQDILHNLPSKSLLSDPSQLKQAIHQSGLFLESKLSGLLSGKTDSSLQGDFKLKLIKLIQLLNQEIGNQNQEKPSDVLELLQDSLQKSHSSLAKLTLDQLHSLPKEDIPKQGWTLELPFFQGQAADSVKIEIEQDKARQSEHADKSWAVSITITPPGLDTIHCKVSCYDGSVNTRFWSETPETVDKINAHLDYLKAQFEKNGLTAGFMEAHQGKPLTTDPAKTATTSLLSEKA